MRFWWLCGVAAAMSVALPIVSSLATAEPVSPIRLRTSVFLVPEAQGAPKAAAARDFPELDLRDEAAFDLSVDFAVVARHLSDAGLAEVRSDDRIVAAGDVALVAMERSHDFDVKIMRQRDGTVDVATRMWSRDGLEGEGFWLHPRVGHVNVLPVKPSSGDSYIVLLGVSDL